MPDPVPECLSCGACCFSPSDRYVWVHGADWKRLGPAVDRVAHFIGNHAFMRMRDGHCIALDIRKRADGTREYFCTIYEQRPQICHALARGSPECEAVLAERIDKAGLIFPGQPLHSLES
jgi:Fe-S-cluster containining protein